MPKVILVIDEDPVIYNFFKVFFKNNPNILKTPPELMNCKSVKQARHLTKGKTFDWIFLDAQIPGSWLFMEESLTQPHTPPGRGKFFITSAKDSAKEAVKALKKGACDYIIKPFSIKELKQTLTGKQGSLYEASFEGTGAIMPLTGGQNPLQKKPFSLYEASFEGAGAKPLTGKQGSLYEASFEGTGAKPLTQNPSPPGKAPSLPGGVPSPPRKRGSSDETLSEKGGPALPLGKGLKKLYDDLWKIRSSPVSVLITGESGVGKEVLARTLHEMSCPQKDKPFVAVNCGAIPAGLMESEMFGHKKGAFTGAGSDRQGFFEMAHGGVLFLDEIGELPLSLQPKLLRVLQEKVVRRVGDVVDRKVSVRLISATNRNLEQMIQNKQFREDLFYRLNVVCLHVPPLRERKEDIPDLIRHFFKKHRASRFANNPPPNSPKRWRMFFWNTTTLEM